MKLDDYKNIFPFEIGTTSYILPVKENNLVYNVNFLKKSFDKIQLLYFGKEYLAEVMSPEIIDDLKIIKEETGIKFSVHLPVDLYLLNPRKIEMRKSIDILLNIFDKTSVLGVNEYILHIDSPEQNINLNTETHSKINSLFSAVLDALRDNFTEDVKKFYIENIYYDLTIFKGIINSSPHRVCFDIGHLFMSNQSFKNFVRAFGKRVHEIHLHGFKNNKDHISLKKVDPPVLKLISEYLSTYKKSVTLEVFNRRNLVESLECLEDILSKKINIKKNRKSITDSFN